MTPVSEVRKRYTRSDPRGLFPQVLDAPELECNRLGLMWRPIVDMAESSMAPMRMRMIAPVSAWLADPATTQVSWFARIGVAGLRRQVLLHAGLSEYECRKPQDLPEKLRTAAWSRLVALLDDFDDLGDHAKALVVFQLAQLSFSAYAASLTGVVQPTGEAGRDQYAYQAARAHSRIPVLAKRVLPVFERLAASSPDRHLALLAAAQGVSHAIRSVDDPSAAQRFEALGKRTDGLGDDWHAHLARSRFHRALALIRVTERRTEDMRAELRAAWSHHELMAEVAPRDAISSMIVVENRRILIESEVKAAWRVETTESAARLRSWAEDLAGIDPTCVEARLVVADAYAAVGDISLAAHWYSLAGELGTVDGATAWYRAGLCFDRIGDRIAAANAMGRCLELDTTAVEPREYLAALGA